MPSPSQQSQICQAQDKLMPVPLCASRDVSQGHGQRAVSPGPPILEKGSDQY